VVPAHLEAGDGYEPFAMVHAPTIVSISDPDAEKATLAAVLLTPGYPNATYVRLAAAGCDAEAFGVPKHAVVWQAFKGLNDRGRPIDIVTLVEELRTMAQGGRLNAIGGAAYLGELTDFIPTLAHCEAHAEIVVEHAMLRRALGIAQEMILVGTGDGSIQERLAKMNSLGLSVPSGTARAKRVSIAEHLADGFEDLEKIMLAKASGKFIAARFGIDTLDGSPDGRLAGMLNGIFPQNVLTIFGAPGSGKTTLAAQAAVVTAQDALAAAGGKIENSRRVVMYCTEMLGPQVSMRLACARGGVDFNRMRSGQCTQDEMDRACKSMSDIAELPIDIIDTKSNRGRLTADDIHSSVHAMIAHGIDIALVVIDYFQDLGRCRGMEKTGDTKEEEARAAKIHDTAVSAKVPIILVSSTDKQTQKDHAAGGKSSTTNARGAGLDFASDVMMGLVNLSNVEKQDDGGRGGGKKSRKPSSIEPDEPPPDGCVYTRGDVVKNRYGGSGEVIFLFDKRHGMFRDYVKQRDGSIPESAYDDAPFDPGE
jgi:replicative DNA helicase